GLGRRYVLKVVGDTVWETARNSGETVVSIDEFQSLPEKPARLERLAERRRGFLRRARLVITPSDYVRRLVMGWGVEAERVKTIRNGISQEEFAGLEPRRRDPGPLEVAFVGRLANWKGVETLLLAL